MGAYPTVSNEAVGFVPTASFLFREARGSPDHLIVR